MAGRTAPGRSGASQPTGPAGTSGAAPGGGQPGAQPPNGGQWPPGGPAPWPAGYPFPVPAPRPHGLMLASSGSRLVARLVDIVAVLVLFVIANAWFAVQFWRDFQPYFADYLRWAEGNDQPVRPRWSTRSARVPLARCCC